MSEPIIREVTDVLNRAEVRPQLPGINDRIVNAFLTKLEAKAISSLLDLEDVDRPSPTVPFALSIPANNDGSRLCNTR